MVLNADKGVALVIIETCKLRNAWPYLMIRKYTMNVETRPSPYIQRWLNVYI